jgi:hypothetical protein
MAREAVASIRVEEAHVIALNGEPQGRIAVFVAGGDPRRAVALRETTIAARDRLVAERGLAGRVFALKWLWLPFWRWRWHRLMQRDCRA